MTYTDLIESVRSFNQERRNVVNLRFPLTGCETGEICDGRMTFRVIANSLDGATIEIIDFKTGDQAKEPDETERRPYIIPSPS